MPETVFESLVERLGTQPLAFLKQNGYLVIDNPLPEEYFKAYQAEIRHLFQAGMMEPNYTATMEKQEG